MRHVGVVTLLLLAACGKESAEKRLPHYQAFGKRFGQALLKGDHLAAYAMTSTRYYQGSTDLPAFKEMLEEARDEYGEATHVGVDYNTLEADGPLGEDIGFPDEVPVKARRARIVVLMQEGPDANDTVYEIWLNLIEEDGQTRIVTMEIPGINM